MIEVEQKFSLSSDQETALTEGAVFEWERSFTDAYLDTPDYSLVAKNWWLRNRDGVWEMKMASSTGEGTTVDHYHEADEEEIRGLLHLPAGDMTEVVKDAGFTAMVQYITTRKHYSFGEFGIDLDSCDFDYRIAEIEVMTPEDEAAEAGRKILAFAAERGITPKPIGTKLIACAKITNQAYFQAVKAAGWIQDPTL